jgi:trigger factor
MDGTFEERDISINITDEKNCRKVVTVEITQERYGSEKERVLRSLVKEVTLPGFRKGKAPVQIVRQRFDETIRSEALKNILPQAYGHIVEREQFEPIGDPVFSEVKEEDAGHLTFRMDIEVVPSFELEDYAGVKVDPEPVEVRDDEVDDVLKNLQERQAEYVIVDRPAVSGDLVTLDYAPIGLDDEPDEKRRVSDYPAQLGVGHLFPEFEKAIAGQPAGFTGRVEIAYPEDYGSEELAGRRVLYQFTVKEVKEKRLPALDDEFARSVEEKFEAVKDLREDIERRLRGEKEREAKRKQEERAIDIIIERNPFEVPLTMIERYRKELEAEDDRRRQAMGAPPELDEEHTKQRDELFGKVASRNIKRYFVLERIAEREGVEVPDEEVGAELEKLGEESGRPIEEVRKYFKKGSDQYARLKNSLREQKIFKIILGTNEGA